MAVLGAVAVVLITENRSFTMLLGVGIGGVVGAVLVLIWAASNARNASRTVRESVRAANEARGAALTAHNQLSELQRANAELQRVHAAAASWPAQFRYHIQQFAARMREGERPVPHDVSGEFTDDRDPLVRLEREHRSTLHVAELAIVQSAELNAGADPAQRLQVFANLGRRLQSLVNREIRMLDELEQQIEDPEILEGIFAVDHLATRIRRQAENLGVLGGARAPRQWTKPLTMVTTLRSAMQEVEHYKRVKMVSPINGTLRGHNVTEIIHLLAELIENATAFSDPGTTVMLSAQNVTAGLAIEVEDRGLGIGADDLERINNLLAGPELGDVGVLLSEGRQIGLWVVAQLARRNDVRVRLARNIFGGVTAAVVVPHSLLGEDSDTVTSAVSQDSRRELVAAGATQAQRTAPRHGAHHMHPPMDDGTETESGDLRAPSPPADDRGTVSARLEPLQYLEPLPYLEPMSHLGTQAEPAYEPDPYRWPDSVDEPAAPVGMPVETPAPAARDAVGDQERPRLPKRRPGTNHLAHELRDPPSAGQTAQPAGQHNPGAAAAFRNGIRAANAEENGTPVVPPTTQAERVPSQGESTHHDR